MSYVHSSSLEKKHQYYNAFETLGNTGLPQSGKRIWKTNFFPVREKSGNFVDCHGNLERTWKVREKSGNKWLWQAVFRKFIYSV